jgi:HK97 family phage major capsid protein
MTKRLTDAELVAFRKLDETAQRKALIGQQVARSMHIERADVIDEDSRTVWLSIASEEPYERWWGIEILAIDKKSIRTERLKLGAPLLVGHDTSDQVGVVDDFEITTDKKLRLKARFGRSVRAEEIFRDVIDGIRKNTSVGYIIHDLVLVKSEEGINTYRVTDWEPYEGSLVPVPADPTVGVGRSALPPQAPPAVQTQLEEDHKMKLKHVVMDQAGEPAASGGGAPAIDTQRVAAEAIAREQQRVADILAAGRELEQLGGVELAQKLITDPKASVETLRAQVLAKVQAGGSRASQTAEPGQQREAYHGQAARHIIRRGGALRAFTKPVRFTDHSAMDPIEAAYRSGQWLRAVIGNVESARQWCESNGMNVRVMTTDSSTNGGYIVPDEMEQAIIDLREQYGLARRLTRRRSMSSDTKSIPKRTGGVTAYFVNEDNSGVTASDKSWGQVNLVAKTLAALSLVSKNLEEDSMIDVVDDLAMEMAYAFATKEDQCWLIGDGTSTYGGMQGLLTMFNAGSYASSITAAADHDTFAEYDNADLSNVMAGVADFPGINPSWVCSKTFAENVFGRLKRTAGGNSGDDLDRRYRYGYGGYPADTSEIMPKVGTSAVTTTEALFGDFSMSSSFGDRRGITIEVLRERYAEKLQVGVLAHERFQVVNHDLGTSSVKGPVAALKGQ